MLPRNSSLQKVEILMQEVEAALQADEVARAALQRRLLLQPSTCHDTRASVDHILPGRVSAVMQSELWADADFGQVGDEVNEQITDWPLACTDRRPDGLSGTVYNKTAADCHSQAKDLADRLAAEKKSVERLQRELEDVKAKAALEKDALQGQVRELRAELAKANESKRTIELERDIFTTHKEGLINALKHDRSLVNYAIATLEQHGLSAEALKRQQQQFAVDVIGGTFVSTSFSVPPSLGGLTPRTPSLPTPSPDAHRLERLLGPPLPDSRRRFLSDD